MFLTQLFARYMVENKIKGYIVNISSMSAYTSSVSRGEYCISKAGVSMITTLFADRLAEYGITVNEIRPGIIHTGMRTLPTQFMCFAAVSSDIQQVSLSTLTGDSTSGDFNYEKRYSNFRKQKG